jgi:peroxiredoxin
MPDLARFYKRHHTDSSDFEILAVSVDREPKDAEEYAAGQKLRFPVLLDSHEKMADNYGVYSIPTMFVIDKNGRIVYGHSGYNATMEYRLASELGIKEDAHGGTE